MKVCIKSIWFGTLCVALCTITGCLGMDNSQQEPLGTQHKAQQQILSEFPSPGSDPQGVAWAQNRLWVVDGKTRQLFRMDTTTGKSERKWELPLARPQGLAWDGSFLRILDAEKQSIYRFDPKDGKIIDAMDAPRPRIESDWSYAGLAVADSCLYVAVSAGWCSKVYCVDLNSGKIRQSFFPQCNPRGLASDGIRLWTLAYNTSKLPAKLNERNLKKPSSHRFALDLWVTDPVAMTAGEDGLWIADRAEHRIFQLRVQ